MVLGMTYDQNASDAYVFFNKSLQQVPCNTTSSAPYSPARNCTDCANAYKQWLCAVTIPRCEDYSNTAPYLQPRAVSQNFTNTSLNKSFPPNLNDTARSIYNQTRTYMNSSRNSLIDNTVVPGPYKEVLPCRDLCYNLVQSCPAVLQFACPLPGFGLEYSYGKWNQYLPPGRYSCNPMAMRVSRGVNLRGSSMLGVVMSAIAILAAVIV